MTNLIHDHVKQKQLIDIDYKQPCSLNILLGDKFTEMTMRAIYEVSVADKIALQSMFRPELEYLGSVNLTSADLPLLDTYISIYSEKIIEQKRKQNHSATKDRYQINYIGFLSMLEALAFYLKSYNQIFIF